MYSEQWIQQQVKRQRELIDALCRIPSPSHREQRKAAFIRDWLVENGVESAFVDEASNVIVPPGEDARECILIMAHTDTVFPDTEPFEPREEGGRLYCPGVGDDTANVAALMLLAQYAAQKGDGARRLIFAANSCEEGLGNLKGCRALMERYGSRIKAVLSMDGGYSGAVNWAVGSARYEVTLRTEGGHSFGSFGNRNAIHAMAMLIASLYTIKPPRDGDSKTTYNVGAIHGGTSVNTIAQEATMLYEYRSDSSACLEAMERAFTAQIEAVRASGVEAEVKVLGIRPGMGQVDGEVQKALEALCQRAVTAETGQAMAMGSGSTDINIPLSQGIPALCFGAYQGGGAHTREEWLELDSLPVGLAIWKRVVDTLGR